MTDWHVVHLGHFALSGAALLTIEATAVEPRGSCSTHGKTCQLRAECWYEQGEQMRDQSDLSEQSRGHSGGQR